MVFTVRSQHFSWHEPVSAPTFDEAVKVAKGARIPKGTQAMAGGPTACARCAEAEA